MIQAGRFFRPGYRNRLDFGYLLQISRISSFNGIDNFIFTLDGNIVFALPAIGRTTSFSRNCLTLFLKPKENKQDRTILPFEA
jgi:hypothetical protein